MHKNNLIEKRRASDMSRRRMMMGEAKVVLLNKIEIKDKLQATFDINIENDYLKSVTGNIRVVQGSALPHLWDFKPAINAPYMQYPGTYSLRKTTNGVQSVVADSRTSTSFTCNIPTIGCNQLIIGLDRDNATFTYERYAFTFNNITYIVFPAMKGKVFGFYEETTEQFAPLVGNGRVVRYS